MREEKIKVPFLAVKGRWEMEKKINKEKDRCSREPNNSPSNPPKSL
jgi:hypothetical protein